MSSKTVISVKIYLGVGESFQEEQSSIIEKIAKLEKKPETMEVEHDYENVIFLYVYTDEECNTPFGAVEKCRLLLKDIEEEKLYEIRT